MKRSTRACVMLALVSLIAAISCVSPTAGVPASVRLALEGHAGRFETFSGWEVELTEARAIIGPIYAYAPSGATAWRAILGPARALAHGGFDPLAGRVVRAELLEPRVIDALASVPVEVAILDGLEGRVDALTLVLAAPSGELARSEGPTRGHTLFVAGIARREGTEIAFEGALDLAEEALRRIDGVAIEGDAPLGEGTRLVVGADARAWLAEADFSGLEGTPAELGPETQPHRALFLGARSADSFSARTEIDP